ncbi:MAG: flagellar hook-basal body complex protein FliE [Candidatus Korobacteraceae bacterium]
MTVDPANLGMRILPADLPQPASPVADSTGKSSFGDSLREAVADVDSLNLDARYKVSSLVEGNGSDVHDAAIAVEKADLSFQLMLQVRNKVVQAYQQIAGMQF